jgi:hypothetical protein
VPQRPDQFDFGRPGEVQHAGVNISRLFHCCDQGALDKTIAPAQIAEGVENGGLHRPQMTLEHLLLDFLIVEPGSHDAIAILVAGGTAVIGQKQVFV